MSGIDVRNKVILITGANRGIGKAYVEAFLNQGVTKIYAGARDLENLKEVTALNPDIIVPVQLDITNDEHIKKVAEQASDLDILVNNAGIVQGAGFTSEKTLEIARSEMETNYFGTLHLVHALLPHLKAKGQSAIVNVSSIAGISNFPMLGTYSATKSAVHSLTQGIRAELSQDGVLVLGVYPGPIETRLTEGFEMDKAPTSQVAEETLAALEQGVEDVFPDDFAKGMYDAFLKSPKALEKQFAQML